MEKNWYDELGHALVEDYKAKDLNLGETDIKAAQDAFWANTKKRLLDVENFHKGYDKEIEKVNLFTIFNDNGKMKHRGTYGDIKKLDQALPVTKALKKFWACQFVDDYYTPAEFEVLKKNEEERRAKEKAEQEARKKEEERLRDKIVANIDKKKFDEYTEVLKDYYGHKDSGYMISDDLILHSYPTLNLKDNTVNFIEINGIYGDGTYIHKLKATDEDKMAKEAGEYLEKEVIDKLLDKTHKEKTYLASVKERPEYEMRKLNKIRWNEKLLFIYSLDKKIVIDNGKDVLDAADKSLGSLDSKAKLEVVIYSYNHEAHSTGEDSKYYEKISLIDNLSPEVANYLKLSTTYKLGYTDDEWGYHKTEERQEADIVNDDRYYKGPDFNKWLYYESIGYPTD